MRIDPKYIRTDYGTREHQLAVAESLTHMAEIGCGDDYLDICKRALRVAYDVEETVVIIRVGTPQKPHGQPYKLIKMSEMARHGRGGIHDYAEPRGSLIH